MHTLPRVIFIESMPVTVFLASILDSAYPSFTLWYITILICSKDRSRTESGINTWKFLDTFYYYYDSNMTLCSKLFNIYIRTLIISVMIIYSVY